MLISLRPCRLIILFPSSHILILIPLLIIIVLILILSTTFIVLIPFRIILRLSALLLNRLLLWLLVLLLLLEFFLVYSLVLLFVFTNKRIHFWYLFRNCFKYMFRITRFGFITEMNLEFNNSVQKEFFHIDSIMRDFRYLW